MAYITLEEAQTLANRSCQESWDEMIRILTEQGLKKIVVRIGKAPRIEWRQMKSSRVAGYYSRRAFQKCWKYYGCISK